MRMTIKATIATVGLAAAVAALLGSAPAQAVNPRSGLQGIGSVNYQATTSSRFLNFTVRVPRSSGSRSTITDVTNFTPGTTFRLEGLLACTNNQGAQGGRDGSSVLHDLVITCPWPSFPSALQFGAMITN